MSIAQIGELSTIASVPVGANIIVENTNDAYLLGIDALTSALIDSKIWVGTQAQYDELGTYTATTLYVIVQVVQQGS